jgi:hypothetical protein
MIHHHEVGPSFRGARLRISQPDLNLLEFPFPEVSPRADPAGKKLSGPHHFHLKSLEQKLQFLKRMGCDSHTESPQFTNLRGLSLPRRGKRRQK